MKGSLNLGSYFGIPVLVHWSFGFIILFIIHIAQQNGMDWVELIWITAYMMVLFLCVVLHEYGHALTARKYGIATKDIILSPIGGVARLEGLPEKPIEEFYIAIAGPLVNLVISIFLFTGLFFTIDTYLLTTIDDIRTISDPITFLRMVLLMNVVLFVFNLIPAFPMDGGRILRSLLSIRFGKEKSTAVASIIGRILAVGFVVIGIYIQHYALIVIGIFVFLMANNEAKNSKRNSKLKNSFAGQVYRVDYSKINQDLAIRELVDIRSRTNEQDFLVWNDMDQMIGVIHKEFLDFAVKNNKLDEPVSNIMTQSLKFIQSSMSLFDLLQIMNKGGYSIVGVEEEGKMIGIIDRKIINRIS